MRATTRRNTFIGIVTAVVIVAVVGGLAALRPPSEERARRLDERRVQDLRGIARAMDLHWTRHGELPASMQDLLSQTSVDLSTHDPGTERAYELRVLEGPSYELCASFELPSVETGAAASLDRDVSEDFWSHGTGRQCFQLDVQEVPSTATRRDP